MRLAQSDITGMNVVFNSRYRINCTVNLTGTSPGAWNVPLTNMDNKTTTLLNGFMVVWRIVLF